MKKLSSDIVIPVIPSAQLVPDFLRFSLFLSLSLIVGNKRKKVNRQNHNNIHKKTHFLYKNADEVLSIIHSEAGFRSSTAEPEAGHPSYYRNRRSED